SRYFLLALIISYRCSVCNTLRNFLWNKNICDGSHNRFVEIFLVCRALDLFGNGIDDLEGNQHDHKCDQELDARRGHPIDDRVQKCIPVHSKNSFGLNKI
ncbi:MAG: hypothetical protein IJ021_04925, partial [Clostridia bacterium]|nr:hypothetical protein [Clostridia bacterium]